jgi:hypothetical protein
MKLRIPPRRAVAFALGTIAACYFVFWACAPTAVLPPPVPFAEHQAGELSAEVGVGAADGYFGTENLIPQVQLAIMGDRGKDFDIGGHLFVGRGGDDYIPVNAGLGVVFRHLGRPSERFAWGIAIQMGWLYGTVGFPVSVKLGRHLWLWTQPGGGLDPWGVVHFPVGMSLETRGGTLLSLQASIKGGSEYGWVDEYSVNLGLSITGRWDRN